MLGTARNFLRLCPRQTVQTRSKNHLSIINDKKPVKSLAQNTYLKSIYPKYRKKILFNSFLEQDKLELSSHKYHMKVIKEAKEKLKREYEEKCRPPIPIALNYILSPDRLLREKVEVEELPLEEDKPFQLPLETTNARIGTVDIDNSRDNINSKEEETNIDKWMTNYEHFDDTILTMQDNENELNYDWCKQYGTPDPTCNISLVPCGGCGALLHCNDPAIPGYLPSEIFKGRTEEELKTIECQRCHFLNEFNIALDISVQPEEYEKILQSIRNVKSLVVLMVDLLDFPCSIWPGIVDIIGTNRPVIVVGNKVDLLPGDSIGYLKRIKECLLQEIKKTKLGTANIKHIALISAKTGYGVENLISVMFKTWLCKGDVFLVGCTNVGKSSLFNALLHSDYCKVHAVDLVKRATVSRWPGTTLNLLKFPINRPSGWKIHERNRRLKADSQMLKSEREIRQKQVGGVMERQLPTLIGHIGRTFSDPKNYEDGIQGNQNSISALNEKEKVFAQSKWLYDTPGVIHPDQVLTLLTTEELLLTIPKQLIRPQTYYLTPGTSLLIGGLARVDFVHCKFNCRFTVFCSNALPVTVTRTEDADDVYRTFLGTELLGVPIGGSERLANWPGLSKGPNVLEFTGKGPKECCGDIVMSSVAWVGVTAKAESVCQVEAWTLDARGIHARTPSVLPYSIQLKGERIRDTPAYRLGRVFVDNNQEELITVKL